MIPSAEMTVNTNEKMGQSVQARERGNEFYKKGKLAEAEAAYNEASTLTPRDPAPISNLSAVKFEMGRFHEAAELAEKALSLFDDVAQDAKMDKLLARLSKCYLHANDPSAALSAAERMAEGEEKTALMTSSNRLLELTKDQIGNPDEQNKMITSRLARYRPCLHDVAEYYAVGHDVPDGLFDDPLITRIIEEAKERNIKPWERDISFLFGGIGDGRNMFDTLCCAAGFSRNMRKVLLGNDARKGKPVQCLRSMHITILDLKAPALAKNLILFDLFDQYHSKMKDKDGGGKKILDSLLCAMGYIFIAVVYPPCVHELVQDSLARLIDAIENGKPICSWVHLPKQSHEPVLHYLRQWQGPALQANRDNQGLRRRSIRQIEASEVGERNVLLTTGLQPPDERDMYPEGCDGDRILVTELNILAPPSTMDIDTGDEPEFRDLLKKVLINKKNREVVRSLDKYIATHWFTNVTLIDLDFQIQWRENGPEYLRDDDQLFASLGYHSVKEAYRVTRDVRSGALRGKEREVNTIGRLAAFFQDSAESALELVESSSLVVEVICGEVADIMEKIRHGCCYEDRGTDAPAPATLGGSPSSHRAVKDVKPERDPEAGPNPSQFPVKYDRIHLSNIPDYTGGPTSVFLFARPLLKPRKDVNVSFNNLLNCTSFDGLSQYHAEYTLLPSEAMIAKIFCLEREPTPDGVESLVEEGYFFWGYLPPPPSSSSQSSPCNTSTPETGKISSHGGEKEDKDPRFIPAPDNKIQGERHAQAQTQPKQLVTEYKPTPMTRPQLERFLYSWFLKICLPYPRSQMDGYAVHSPFNLSIFLRLVNHLHKVTNFPAHWLATILHNLASGSITTTARPPAGLVVKVSELTKAYAPKKTNISPWTGELTTLLALWRPVLGFGFVLPPNATISPKNIVACSIKFPGGFKGYDGLRMSRFMLLFWSDSLMGGKSPNQVADMRKVLCGDGVGSSKMLESGGVHVVSVFEYRDAEETARFWMREDLVDALLGGGEEKENDWRCYMWRTDTWRVQPQQGPRAAGVRRLAAATGPLLGLEGMEETEWEGGRVQGIKVRGGPGGGLVKELRWTD